MGFSSGGKLAPVRMMGWADSKDGFRVLFVCPAYCNTRNLDDMGVVNGIFGFSQCLTSSGTLRCANAYTRVVS